MAKKHTKRWTTSLVIREMQIKTTDIQLIPIEAATIKRKETTIDKDVKKLEPLGTVFMFTAALGLCFWAWAFSSCCKWGILSRYTVWTQ